MSHPSPPPADPGPPTRWRPAPTSAGGETVGATGTDGGGSMQLLGAAEQWLGKTLGKYRIGDVLGVGGMGVVLQAHDPSIGRDVAIKILPPDLAADETALRRFLGEARSAGKIAHPHAITIYEVADEGPIPYLAMELATGGTAQDRLDRLGPLPVDEATRLTIEASQGLGAAHRLGFVHRDVKPSNLLLTSAGSVKVSDFGLAKRVAGESLGLTQEGRLVGTPFYMSPEQCEALPLDPRSDIYALGGTYYTLLTGKPPYADSANAMQVLFAHCRAEPPDPRDARPNLPAACAAIVRRAMAKDPAARYPTVEAMEADLQAVRSALSAAGGRLPPEASPGSLAETWVAVPAAAPRRARRRWLAAAAGAALALAGAWGLWRTIGGSGGSGGPPRRDASVPTGAAGHGLAAAPPVRIGVVHSLSGTMADSESPVVDATLLAVEEVNRAGGVAGRPVEALVADGRSDPEAFLREARRLIDQEQVCTLFGCWTSASRKTVIPLLEQRDHLLVYPVQYEGVEESPNVAYLGAAPNQQILPAVDWAYATLGKRRFFLVGSDYVFPRVAHAIIDDRLQELGARKVGEAYVPLGSLDVQGVVEQIRAAQPDAILNTINGDANRAFFSALRRAGVASATTPTISFSLGEEELRKLDPQWVAGDYAAWNYFESIETPANRAFLAAFRQKYGPQRIVTDPMEAAYAGVLLWAQAARTADAVEPTALRRALRNQRIAAPEGELRIDPATQHAFKTPRIGQVQHDGRCVVVWTADAPEPPRPYPPTRTSEQWRGLLNDLYRGWGDRWQPAAVDALGL